MIPIVKRYEYATLERVDAPEKIGDETDKEPYTCGVKRLVWNVQTRQQRGTVNAGCQSAENEGDRFTAGQPIAGQGISGRDHGVRVGEIQSPPCGSCPARAEPGTRWPLGRFATATRFFRA